MPQRLPWLAALLACALLAACGTPGAPQPPSLQLPRTVQDLSAHRKGSKVTLVWTPPRQTTDRQNIRHPGPTVICRQTDIAVMIACAKVAELQPVPLPAAKGKPAPQSYSDQLPAELQRLDPLGFANYAVQLPGPNGRTAGLSNQVQVPLAPTLPPPSDLQVQPGPNAIQVSAPIQGYGPMTGLQFSYHLFRREEKGPVVDLGPSTGSLGPGLTIIFLDRSFEWEKIYYYHIASVTIVNAPGRPEEQLQGDDSPEYRFFAHDVFPPAPPGGLQAVFSGPGQKPFIDLTWAPNTESDLAGYNVYRHEQGAVPVRINQELVKTPSFRDANVEAGHRYYYSVSAVDLRGNESHRSAETSEEVPR